MRESDIVSWAMQMALHRKQLQEKILMYIM